MMGLFPGWPGPAFLHGRPLIADVMHPAMPGMPGAPAHPGPGGPAPAAAASPISGMAAYGVPLGQTPTGRPFLQAGGPAGGGTMLPPAIAGMPMMPGPPPGMLTGGPPGGGGLFQPMAPVVPFDQSNQTRQYQAQ